MFFHQVKNYFKSSKHFAMKPHCCTLPKFQNVSHVIFDLDGTILDTEKVSLEAINNIARENGKKFTTETKLKLLGRNELVTAEICVEEIGLPMSPVEFLKIYRGYSDKYIADVPFMPGAEKMIKHLHTNNIPIAIATSSAQDQYELKASKKRDIFDLFHHIVCGSTDPEVKNGKPAPDIYLICASRFDENPLPSKCLVFEDAINGMRAALDAGMQVIMIPDDSVSCEFWRQATLRIDSFECMIPELFGLPSFEISQKKDIPESIDEEK